MSYTPVHIPFITGQDERFDKKLLPVGPLRSVYNMQLQRDGRMVRREALERYELRDENTGTADRESVRYTEKGFFTKDRKTPGDGRRFAVWGPEFVHEHSGNLPLIDRVRHIELGTTATPRTANPDLYPSFALSGGVSQICPQVDTDVDGQILFAVAQGRTVVVSIRDKDTRDELYRFENQADDADEDAVWLDMKMVASKKTNTFAIVGTYITGGNTFLRIRSFESKYPFAEIGTASLGSGLAQADSFDAHARPDRDSFIVARQEGTGAGEAVANIRLEEIQFNALDAGFLAKNTVYVVAHGGTGDIKTSCYSTVTRWGLGFIASDGSVSKVLSSSWYGGAVTSEDLGAVTSSTPWTVPPMFSHSGTENDFFYITRGRITDFTSQVGSENWTWDLSGGTSTVTQIGEDSATFPATHPIQIEDDVQVCARATIPYNTELRQDETYLTTIHVSPLDKQNPPVCRLGATAEGLHETFVRQFYNTVPPKPAKVTDSEGNNFFIFPYTHITRYVTDDGVDDFQIYKAVWGECSTGYQANSRIGRSGEEVSPGGVVSVTDSTSVLTGYSWAPVFVSGPFSNAQETFGSFPNGDYLVQCVLEYKDDNGRQWLSQPSEALTCVVDDLLEDSPQNIWGRVAIPAHVAAPDRSCRLLVYTSDRYNTGEAASPLYLRSAYNVEARSTIEILLTNYQEGEAESIGPYTSTGELSNEMPPACEFAAVSRQRVWVGGLDKRSRVQSSKPFNEERGIEWSNLDNFFVDLPGDCTGLAAIDDSVVAFTTDNVFAIHGGGPDNGGIGTYSPPQRIPTTVGCINHLSVITNEDGVFFQSRRGIEFMSRGFSSPEWVGQAVRDTLQNFPICRGSAISPEDSTVRWLFVDQYPEPTASRVVIYDSRVKGWYVHEYDDAYDMLAVTNQNGRRVTTVGKQGRTKDPRHLNLGGVEHGNGTESFLETGSLRVAGLQSWAFGRRAHIMGDWGGEPCDVTLEFAFNDEDWLPQDTITWTIDDEEFQEGPVNFELTLPVQQFDSVRFRVKVSPLSSPTSEQLFTYKPNGITVYFSPAPEGPRLAARNKG